MKKTIYRKILKELKQIQSSDVFTVETGKHKNWNDPILVGLHIPKESKTE
jgi:hypothetical protein